MSAQLAVLLYQQDLSTAGLFFFLVNMDIHTLIQGLANTLDAELRKQAETFLEEVSGGRVACSLGRF